MLLPSSSEFVPSCQSFSHFKPLNVCGQGALTAATYTSHPFAKVIPTYVTASTGQVVTCMSPVLVAEAPQVPAFDMMSVLNVIVSVTSRISSV